MTKLLLIASSAAMGALWMAGYVCAKRQRRVLQMIAIQAGTVFVWPLLAIGSAVMGLNWIYEGINDPIAHPVMVIVPAGAAVASFTIWMAGISVAIGYGTRWSGDPRRGGLSV